MMDDLLTDFIAEVREMLSGCEEAIVAWEADPADRARLDTIFRFVHTVKGNCGFFDLPRLAALSHAAEDALSEVRAGRRVADATLVTGILAIIDRLADLTDALEKGDDLSQGSDADLIAALEGGAQNHASAAQPTAEQSGSEPAAPSTSTQTTSRSIRVPVELLDEVMSGMSDTVLARNDLARRLRGAGVPEELESAFERLSGILADVRGSITRMRMNRFDQLFLSIPRLVRDLAHDLGKQAAVTFEGGDVELDREIMELIRDPITHILRNAVDHGLEEPASRVAAGKPAGGTLFVAARHSGNQVCLTIADDGRGISPDRIVAAAVKAGIIAEADAARMTPEQQLNLIFAPGLSTAREVSAVSGRGVGMDVVRANLERIGGSIAVESVPGERTEFHLTVPLTLSIIPGIIVEAGGQQFAIPQSFVAEIVRDSGQQTTSARAGETRLIDYRQSRIPLLQLQYVLRLAAGEGDKVRPGSARTTIVLQISQHQRFALGVERITDHEDLVVKPLMATIMELGAFAGLTLLSDGKPILLLDVRGLAQRHGLFAQERQVAAETQEDAAVNPAADQETALLVTGLDGMVRAVRFARVERVHLLPQNQIDRRGTTPIVALGGEILRLYGLERSEPLPEMVKTLQLRLHEQRVLYAVQDIGDCVPFGTIMPEDAGDKEHEGLLLLGDRPVRLLNADRLFIQLPTNDRQRQLVCALPDDDWARTILGPLLQEAGYRIDSAEAGPADVSIALDGRLPPSVGSRVLHLTSASEAAPPGSIHQADRDALLAALAQIRAEAAA